MIQMVFLGPAIYYVVKRFDFHGFTLCFIATGIWETISYCLKLADGLYALISLRFISLFAFGCFIAIGKKKLNSFVLIIMFIAGVVWQTLLNYIPLYPQYMNNSWARVNLYSSLFVLPIMYIIIRKYSNSSTLNMPIIQEIGKASYNVFLVQMAFYGCGCAQIIYKHITNVVLQLMICIAACISIGCIYFKIEHPITRRIISTMDNNANR